MAITTVDLETFLFDDGFSIRGISPGDRAGISISMIGDINADGISDLIVGQDNSSVPGSSAVGESYVIFGQNGDRPPLSLRALDGTNGFRIIGSQPGDRAGAAVSEIGDINGDGITDVVIGAPGHDDGQGAAFVILGRSGIGATGDLDLANLAPGQGFRLEGASGRAALGQTISSAGDINNDGFDDLIIGAPDADNEAGLVFVLFGGEAIDNNGVVNLNDLEGDKGFQIQGREAGDRFGSSVSRAGDVNDDGIEDFLVGAPNAEGEDPRRPTELAGRSYLFFGDEAIGAAGQIRLEGLEQRAAGLEFIGRKRNDLWGSDVSNIGDVNGDGVDDFALGSPGRSPVEEGEFFSRGGQATMILGNSDPEILDTNLRGPNAIRIKGPAADVELGNSISGVGDVNGDGIDDILIGASQAGEGGKAYLVFGREDIQEVGVDLRTIDGINAIEFNGVIAGGELGSQVSNAGDINQDGINDLMITAPQAMTPAGRIRGGMSYVFYGMDRVFERPTRHGDRLRGTANGDRINGLSGRDQVYGLDGNDTLLGALGDDYLHGGIGNDVARGGGGGDTLIGSLGDDRLVGQAGDDQLEGGLGDDVLLGGADNNFLDGGGGNDILAGGVGFDTMVGGAGNDRFVVRRLGVDTIRDFAAGDRIQFGQSDFGAGLEVGELSEDQFVIGVAPADATTRFFYNADTRRLFFDGDGTNSRRGRVLVARFSSDVALTHEDFEVI